jgi:phospholipid transport system substrate-binding protein
MEAHMRSLAHAAGAFFLLSALAAPAAEVAPDALVKSNVEEVLSVIKQSKDRRALNDLAEKKVLPHFDFQAMTQLAVGKSWREANQDQQRRLEHAFRGLLVNTYTAALNQSAVGDAKVEVKPAQVKPEQSDVTVKTVATQSSGKPVAIDYRMKRTANGWKVYDVVVENLSLVTNYRDSFSAEISRTGIEGLIKALEAKNQKVAQT